MNRLLPIALATATAAGCVPGPTVADPAAAPAPVAAPARAPATGAQPVRLLVRPGVDMLAERLPPVLEGKRVGLITNQTGRASDGRSTIDVLAADSRLRLVALFGPEHGIRGAAAPGETVDDARDERTGLPIHSLYGATRKPTPAMLQGIDALVFDIQDVGSRTYTYVYTMALAMEAAREQGIPFVVLDRPNPIGGQIVEGNILDTAYASFVGMYPIPVRHGMTVGELAQLFNRAFGIGADLTVVRMDGWRRDLWWDQTGLDFVPPSPNIRRLEAAIHYPGTVFFEGTNLSEGRGSDYPFEQTGAPWLRADTVVAAMTAMHLPGVRFETVEFTPAASAAKFGGQALHGVRLHVTDREAYRPVRTALLLIDTIRRLHPEEFRFTGPTAQHPDAYWIDTLAGTDRLRKAMEAGRLPAELEAWERDARGFEAVRRPYLLYE
ncbi:MAG TPA: DUF1343 domain-containing protein [Gemmatimonadaceae bacterium]|nr:DUF1343 domain-containing protein [Gemmatimonadaceae bacterium]